MTSPPTNISSIDYHLFGTHVRFGPGCSSALRQELTALGSSHPVILMQSRMAASDSWKQLRATLDGVNIRLFTSVPTHSSVEWVESVAKDIHDFPVDSIVAIGGGSVSDSAKALSMLLAEGGELTNHVTGFIPPSTVNIPVRTRTKLPIISLPTTASGAEVTPSFGARQDDHKLLFWNRNLASTTILIDPSLSHDLPLDLLRTTAMNGLAHCFEGMYSKQGSMISDGIALQSIDLFAKVLKGDESGQHDERASLLLAGHLSGMVLSMSKSCLHHAICHVIGARHQVGHGQVNSIILPHALRFNEKLAQNQLAPALTILNTVSGTSHRCVSDWVSDTIERLDLPSTLSGAGITADDLPAIAQQTMGERGLAVNPRPVEQVDDVQQILRQAL